VFYVQKKEEKKSKKRKMKQQKDKKWNKIPIIEVSPCA